MISVIAKLLHLPAIEDPKEAARIVKQGGCLVREDDVKEIVCQLRDGYDALRAENARLREALVLLLEEAQDESRCAQEVGPGVYRHHLSRPCRDKVKDALEGKEEP